MTIPKLIACDVDGTLARDDHRLSAYTQSVLRRVSRLGVAVVIITGRTENSALGTARQLGQGVEPGEPGGFSTGEEWRGLTERSEGVPVVSCNGAIATDPATMERLWLKTIDPAYAAQAVAVAERVGVDVEVWTTAGRHAAADSPSSQLLTTILQESVNFGPLDEVIAHQTVVKLMLGGNSQHLDEVTPVIERELPGMERSMSAFFEAAPAHGTKQEALGFVLDYLGIEPQDCWGFGDGGNDQGWLTTLGRAIAPANARAAIQALAHQQVASNNEDGPAHYLEDQLFG